MHGDVFHFTFHILLMVEINIFVFLFMVWILKG